MNPGFKRRLQRGAALSVILGAAAMLGSGALIRKAARGRTYSDIDSIPHRRVGLLLGCRPRLADGRANLFFTHRIAAAAQLFAAGKIDYLIVSGDNHKASYDETTGMKLALVDAGIPADRICCDYAGFRTLDSIVRAREVFGQQCVTVISQEFHNQRAIYIARHKGVDAQGFNARDVDSSHRLHTRIRECFARVRTVLDVCLFKTRPKFLGPRIDLGTSHG